MTQVIEEVRQEHHMLEVLKSEKQDLENEVCRFRVMKAKLLQQIGYLGILCLCCHSGQLLSLLKELILSVFYLISYKTKKVACKMCLKFAFYRGRILSYVVLEFF